MVNRVREMTVAGEALGSVLFRLEILNRGWSQVGLPTWTATTEPLPDDAHLLTLTAPTPTLAGQRVVGSHTADGATALPGSDEPVPEVVGACTVCGTRRARRHLLLVDPDGAVTAVGATCLATWLTEHGQPVMDVPTVIADPVGLLTITANHVTAGPHVETDAVLAIAMHVTAVHGYVNRERAQRTGDFSTGDLVRIAAEAAGGDITALAPAIQNLLLPATVLRVCALDDLPTDTDFGRKIHQALTRDTTPIAGIPLIASVPHLYARHERTVRANAEGRPVPGQEYAAGYVGEPKQRLTLTDVRIENARLLDTGSTLVIMRDTDGHRLTWFASNPAGLPPVDTATTLTCTVVSHAEFAGVTSTQVNRCRFA